MRKLANPRPASRSSWVWVGKRHVLRLWTRSSALVLWLNIIFSRRAETRTFWSELSQVFRSEDIRMYSRYMIGAFCCAVVASILLVVSMATDHWIEVNSPGSRSIHLGLWKIVTSLENRKDDTIAMGFCNSIRFFIIASVILCNLGNLSFAPFFSRINRCGAAGIMFFLSTFCAFLAMAVFTGMKVKYFDRFNYAWGYIMGWIALILTFVAGVLTRYAFKGEA